MTTQYLYKVRIHVQAIAPPFSIIEEKKIYFNYYYQNFMDNFFVD